MTDSETLTKFEIMDGAPIRCKTKKDERKKEGKEKRELNGRRN